MYFPILPGLFSNNYDPTLRIWNEKIVHSRVEMTKMAWVAHFGLEIDRFYQNFRSKTIFDPILYSTQIGTLKHLISKERMCKIEYFSEHELKTVHIGRKQATGIQLPPQLYSWNNIQEECTTNRAEINRASCNTPLRINKQQHN